MPDTQGTGGGGLIVGSYVIEGGMALEGAGGGLPSFAVTDLRHGRRDLMAVQAAAGPARAEAVAALLGVAIPGLVLPLAYGGDSQAPACANGRPALYVVCPRPPCVALDAQPQGLRAWRENELLDAFLRPAALALDHLARLGITHRAIRPNNVFQSNFGTQVVLGCAWASPPAVLQPSVFEPPYSAQCHPAGRGDGGIADDVYALGVLMLILATGQVPLADVDPETILRRKLEVGSFAALTAKLRLPTMVSDLVRGMLAEEPSHRPTPALLADPLAARARRVAARPPSRAPQPIELGGMQIWNARQLALAMSRDFDPASDLMQRFRFDVWLRRTLGDPLLAAAVEEGVYGQINLLMMKGALAPVLMVMRAISLLDPLAPLCWRGISCFPDALGTLMAATDEYGALPVDKNGRGGTPDFVGLIETDAIDNWIKMRAERVEAALRRREATSPRVLLHMPGWAGGTGRLRYELNPLLPCRSPRLGAVCVVRLAELLPALEAAAAQNSGAGDGELLLDAEIGAFLSALLPSRVANELDTLAQPEETAIDPPGHRGLAQLRVLSMLQEREAVASWHAVARRARAAVEPALTVWRNRALRANRTAALDQATADGQLIAMLEILTDPHALRVHDQAAAAAQAELNGIRAQLSDISRTRTLLSDLSEVSGHEVAMALGVIALVLAIVATILAG